MSQVAIITDTHFGAKNGDETWLNSQLTFFRKEFLPYLKKNGIKDIIHLGDLFDNREITNNRVAYEVKVLFEQDFADFNTYVITGNHDAYFKTRVDISINKFLDFIPHVKRISDIELINIDNRDILLVPWQTDWEKFAIEVANKNTSCEVCMGHFPITGFMLNNKVASAHGVSPDVFFKNFKRTFSGHYHTRSEKTQKDNKIIYPGNTYHLTRHDIGDNRGFCVLDTETLKHRFVNSTKTIKYVKATYPDVLTKKDITGNIVDIHVKYDENYNEKEFLEYISGLEEYTPIGTLNIKAETVKPEQVELEEDYTSTLDLIKGYVNLQEDINDPEAVNIIIEEIYNKSLKGADE